MAGSNSKIKFPILNNVEYLDIIQNKTTVQTFNTLQTSNLKWRDLQKFIGKKHGGGMFRYAMKFVDNDVIYRGTIRGLTTPGEQPTNDKDTDLRNELEQIKKSISGIGQQSGVSVDLLLSMSKQSYEVQINFLNAELTRKDNFILKQETQITKLEDELDKCDLEIEQLRQKTGIGQYVELAQTFLSGKIGNLKPISNLKDSNPSDIPNEIINILGLVDWKEVDTNILEQIINYLKIFIQKLPLKNS